MNALFFGMSVVVLIVMIVTMWKDTHPAWMAYQDRFAKLERGVLLERQADLQRQLNHPDPLADYKVAKSRYDAAKDASDAASSKLEGTEADLEEVELQMATPGEGEGGGGTASLAATSTAKPAANDMAELDKAAGGDGSAQGAKAAATSSADDMAALDKAAASDSGKVSKAVTPAKASSNDMAELDKAAASNTGAKGAAPKAASPKGGSNDMAELDKAAAKSPANAGSSAKGGSGGGSDMSELDKAAAQPQAPTTAAQAAPAEAAPAPTFEEADLAINQAGADAQLQAAESEYLQRQRIHSREMIGLPKSDELDRKHADLKLAEAEERLDVAKAGVELERRKVDVKAAAQVARWSQDATTLGKVPAAQRTEAQSTELQADQSQLTQHHADLERDLRLVESRLKRNSLNVREIQQVYVPRLGAVDRCQSCHLGIDDPLFANLQEPFRTHPGTILKTHPIDKYGCVSCHGGFGSALDTAEAHGQVVGKGVEMRVGVEVQASCGKCHGDSKSLAGALTYLSGKELFETSGCVGCHKVDQIQQSLKTGPSLDGVAKKLSTPWLVKWLQNPQSHSVEARMPNLGLTLHESQAISAYLVTQSGAPPLPPAPPPPAMSPADMLKGKALTESLGCLGCHTINGRGSNIGPELTNVRAKVRPDWLYAWLLNPRKYLVNSRMPNFNLTQAQATLIGNYLLALGINLPPEASPPPDLNDKALIQEGSQLIAQRGCAGCHDIKGYSKMAAPDLSRVGEKTVDVLEFGNSKDVKHTVYDWLVNKVLDPATYNTATFKSRMPKFGLDRDEAEAIAVFLTSLSSTELPPEYLKGIGKQDAPLEAGRQLFADKECAACHRIAGEGGKIGPDLTHEGEMVQPNWLFKFLKKPVRIRWWQDARMPDFNLTDNQATTLTEYFMALSNQEEPYVYTPPEQLVFPLASAGKKYFDELKCQSCHPLAGKQNVAGGDTKKIGPDLGMVPARLKADWMLRFLRDPQSFSPGTQMPTFNKPDYEYKAIIDFLMKQGP